MSSDDHWQWKQSEQLAFDLPKELACASGLLHGDEPALPSEVLSGASGTGGDDFIRQLQPYPDEKAADTYHCCPMYSVSTKPSATTERT